MADRPSALLTNAQRKYVMGDNEHDNPTNERKLRSRLKDRVYTGIEQDGKILAEMDPAERRAIFREWENRNYESHPSGIDIPKSDDVLPDVFEKSQFKYGVRGLLKFLYLGVEEGDVGDFWEILESALDKAAQERGQAVKTFEPNIEFADRDPMTLEDIYEGLEAGEIEYGDLPLEYISKLLESELLDVEDIPEDDLETIVNAMDALERLEETLEQIGRDEQDDEEL